MSQGPSVNPAPIDEPAALQELRDLCNGFFRDTSWIERCAVVAADEMPTPARRLLVHQEHMTPRLRAFHGQELRLEVRAERLDGEQYSRKIKLLRAEDGYVAEFGIMRIDLRCVPGEARAEILGKQTPLGDVLAQHRVLTEVEPRTYFRFVAPSPVLACLAREGEAFGRLATIHCNGTSAVELLEVVPA